ncbi:MAG: family 10 glycosylhydrolase [Okeania sp. SIO3I5]|nr:family 10 glycosylhydrolase [Okeania sp. SIO3I5]
MVLLPTPGRANVLLGIIRDPENIDEWNQIIIRIRGLGISYEPIDLRQINTLADLSGVKVIFLPNIETLTKTQVEIIEEWVKQGGKLIASGQIGKKSQAGVRQKLRSLLGSYWAFPLSQPTTPEPKYRCLDITCQESTSWAPKANNQGRVAGGVLIPSGLNSTTAATWKGSSGSSAVVITPEVTYFGWHWGDSTSATLDSIWLQATLNRYQSQPQFSAGNNNPFPSGNNRLSVPTANSSNPVKIQPLTTPSPRTTSVNTAENSNINSTVNTAQNSTVNQENIWLRSQQQKISTEKTQATERLGNQNNSLEANTTTVPKSNNVWERFEQQREQQNRPTEESISGKDTAVSSPENLTSETTNTTNNNKSRNIWNRFPQQQNRQSETVINKETIVSSPENLTSETTNNNKSRNIWNRFQQQNRQSETVTEKDIPVSDSENLTSETTNNNKSRNIWNRFQQQKEQQHQPSETASEKDTIISSRDNPTPQTNNRRSIWNRTQQQTKTTSSSRRNPLAALLRPLPLPQIQVPNSQTDPSSESAPAGLDIRQGNYPINNAEAYAMLKELNNLLGRFESALVAAQSANVEVNLAADGSSLVAANNNNSTFIAQRNRKISHAQQIVTKARQVIQNFPQQVAAKQYATARSQWLQTRQMLWNNYPTDGERAGAEIRAVWLDRGTIVRARSERGLAMVFDRLAAAGINTVFFETLNAGYTIYPSNIAPKQNPLTISWDPLKAAVKLAQERNMEIHAWIWTFAVGNQAHNRALGQADSYLGPVISAHPDWVMTDNKGRKRHPNDGKVYMDPANPEVRQYLLNIIDEIASRYEVDGIQLDYIRYPFQDPSRNFSYGYSTTARNQFRQLYGIDPMKISSGDRQNLWKWNEFKINQVNRFVANTSNFLKRKYPRLILSAAVFPFPRHERFDKIQQDWESWVLKGEIDLLTPMTYALDTNRFQQITQPLTNTGVLGSTLITPAVKLLNIPEIVAVDQIQAARDLPTGGYIIFAAERITGGLHGFLTRTQGAPERGDNRRASLNSFTKPAHVVEGIVPYRQPFVAAADRFQALKKEWSFLLENEQLSLTESQLESWRQEAGELALVLEKLADNPDSSNLNNARRSLRKFQLKLRTVMSVHARQNAYQVQTWQNRLAALEMLLNYGERVRLNSQRF